MLKKGKLGWGLVIWTAWPSLFANVFFEPTRVLPWGEERTGEALVYLDREGDVTSPATVKWSVSSMGTLATDDFVSASGEAIFPPGETNLIVTIQVKRDGLVEGSETFDFTLDGINGDQLSGTNRVPLMILDGETPVLDDPSFQSDQRVDSFQSAVKLHDGSILGARDSGFLHGSSTLIKLNPDGQPDQGTRFDVSIHVRDLSAAYETPDGLLIGGELYENVDRRSMARFLSSGEIDRSFSAPDSTTFVAFQKDGRAILIQNGTNIIRANLAGKIDPTFRPSLGGDSIISAAIDADDGIFVLIGVSPDQVLFRLNADGSLDEDFGKIPGSFSDMVPNGQYLYVMGAFRDLGIYGFLKLSRNGTVAGSLFDLSGRAFPAADGKLFFVGYLPGQPSSLTRLNEDLTIDPSFIWMQEPVSKVLDNGDGTLLIAAQGGVKRIYATNANLSQIEFTAPTFGFFEGSTGTVTLRRIGRTAEPCTVKIEASPLEGSSEGLAPRSVEVTFARLQTNVSANFTFPNNSVPEHDRLVKLAIVDQGGTLPGINSNAVLRIVDTGGRPGSLVRLAENAWQAQAPAYIAAVFDLKRHSSGKIVAATRTENLPGEENYWPWRVAVFDQTGKVDFQFGNPRLTLGLFLNVGVQTSGKLVLSGEHGWGPCALRLNQDGTYDSDFQETGISCHAIWNMVVQPDDKLLVSGSFSEYVTHMGFTRLLPNGQTDRDFTPAPEIVGVGQIALQGDGKIILEARTSLAEDIRIIRLNSNGSLDLSFSPIQETMQVSSFALQPDGKILAGFFEQDLERGEIRSKLVRFDHNGAPDGSFKAIPIGRFGRLLPLANGQIVVAGTFQTADGMVRTNLILLNADGSVNLSFDAGVAAPVSTMLLLDNGDLLVGGAFTEFNNIPCSGLAVVKMQLKPGLRSLAVTNSQFAATVVGSPQDTIWIEKSSDLKQWTPLQTVTLSGYSASFSDQITNEKAFYRLGNR
jgi:uncharacterized delta-60 repeat protein